MAKGLMNSEGHGISALVKDVQTIVENGMRKAYNDVISRTWRFGTHECQI